MPSSLSLLLPTLSYLRFLTRLSQCACLPSLNVARWRYIIFWLPLKKKYPDEKLEPPVDILWVWVLHMLNPDAYRKDCIRIFGTIITNHCADDENERECMCDSARELWIQHYDTPFEINQDIQDTHTTHTLSVDLEEEAICLRKFYYQVSLPHYKSVKFIQAATQRYEKLLLQTQAAPFILSTYDIILVMHAHMLQPQLFYKDCMNLRSSLFTEHDFHYYHSPREPNHVFETLQSLALPGSMYRGHNNGDYASDYCNREGLLRSAVYDVGLSKISIKDSKPGAYYTIKLTRLSRNRSMDDSQETICIRNVPLQDGKSKNLDIHFMFDSYLSRYLYIEVEQTIGSMCWSKTEVLGQTREEFLNNEESDQVSIIGILMR